MALPIKINNQYGWANVEENGGKGSGNFGHGGRPGKVGGSTSGRGGTYTRTEKDKKELKDDEPEHKGSNYEKAEYEAVIAEEATFRGIKGHRRIKDIAKRFDKDPGEVEQDIDDYQASKVGRKHTEPKGKEKGFQSEYKVGDSYTKGGVTYDVVDGENGPHAVSKDGKITTELPDKLRHDQTKMIEDTFDSMRDEGIPMSAPRYDAARDMYKRVQGRAIETSRKGLDASEAPKMVREEVDRLLKQIETTGPSVEAYHKTATGILDAWAKGNGGLSKPQSSQVKGEVKELKAELDSLYERYRIMTTPKGFRK